MTHGNLGSMKATVARMEELARLGVILTSVENPNNRVWTVFEDMHANGYAKEPWEKIYIEASPKVALKIFISIFGHDPGQHYCKCCGAAYFQSTHNKGLVKISETSLFIQKSDIRPEWHWAHI